MSSEESEAFDFDDGSGSDGFEEEQPKKVAPKKVAAKPKASPKARAVPKAKAAPKPKVVKKVAVTSEPDAMDEDEDEVAEMAGPAAKAAGGKKTASETYTKLSQLDHVLKRPDTYIGSVEPITQPMWVYGDAEKSMIYRSVTFVPGLFKIVDEILVNAADNKIRDSSMNTLKVNIDVEEGVISVYNDGKGIPVEMHATEGCYIPELIFGHLLTSSNYDDDERKVTGGRNGYGAKLANIYSTEFIVETCDSASGLRYKQTFKNNMSSKDKPKITPNKAREDWTKITFKPDLVRFNMQSIDPDTVALINKRVYDMAGITKGVKVFLNDKQLRVKDFEAYVKMYTNAINEINGTVGGVKISKKGELAGADPNAVVKPAIIYEKFGDRWEVAFAISEGQFQQVSFCNSIATTKGGTHVSYIADQIVGGIVALVNKKNKAAPVKPFQIKNHLWVFVNCLVENPAFDSQTKENMTLQARKFGSKCVLTEEFLKKVCKSGVVDNVLNWAKFKQDQMMKKADGGKRARITGLVKLEDANNAGTRSGSKCTLILTEGDSAKALAVSGLAVVGRDNYGVFPLRGKLLNVREATGKSLMDNAEIVAIKQIMGLKHGTVYDSVDGLRYGSLMIMADQDHDGSHIKGLIINFLDHFFPSLLKIPNFLLEFITPIVKVTKGKKELSFFTIPEYETWKEENANGKGWKIKYFKGLGTSTATDAKKYFGDMKQHRLPFKPATEEDRDLIDMAFNKKKADNRKDWLRAFIPGTYMDHNVREVPLADFINKELILFSMADNIRSIPSVVDGFKPGQRKIIFACFKRKLKAEIKVGQLSGYVAEHSAYHHGDVSLNMTIIGLAQEFVGSNNINTLDPNGQFGTRLQGGKDAASARYIFTNVAQITRTIFQPADDNVLNYLNDDGQSIEPSWYIPILPMVLVNGSDGIGTGWSSNVPNYNPSEIVANLKRKMAGEELVPLHPWYRGFRGTIEKAEKEKDKYKVAGIITRVNDDTVEITELPIKAWTQTYKESLEGWVAGTAKAPPMVKDYKEYHTDTTVHFVITINDAGKALIKKEGLEKAFKCTGSLATSNMVCFDAEGKIKKYATPEEILLDFYDIRMDYYHRRKAFLVDELSNAHDKLSNQARFIQMIISKELVINNKKRASVVAELRAKKFRPFPKVVKPFVAEADEQVENEIEELDEQGGADSDFDYLLGMALYSLTAEKVAKLLSERDSKETELTALLNLSAQDLWVRDLDAFTEQWDILLAEDTVNKNRSIKAAKNKGKGKKQVTHSSDSDSEEYEVKKPVKKATASKAKAEPKAATVPLPTSEVSMIIDEKSSAVKPKARAAPKKVTAAAAKKRASTVVSDEEEEKPKKVVKKAKVDSEEDIFAKPTKAPVKKAPVKKTTPKSKVKVDSDSEDEPVVKKKAAPKAAAKPKAAPKAKAAPKKKDFIASDDDESDVPVVKKAATKKLSKKVADSDEDDDDAEIIASAPTSKPSARGARTAAVSKKAYVMDVSDEDVVMNDDAEEDESEFENDDD